MENIAQALATPFGERWALPACNAYRPRPSSRPRRWACPTRRVLEMDGKFPV